MVCFRKITPIFILSLLALMGVSSVYSLYDGLVGAFTFLSDTSASLRQNGLDINRQRTSAKLAAANNTDANILDQIAVLTSDLKANPNNPEARLQQLNHLAAQVSGEPKNELMSQLANLGKLCRGANENSSNLAFLLDGLNQLSTFAQQCEQKALGVNEDTSYVDWMKGKMYMSLSTPLDVVKSILKVVIVAFTVILVASVIVILFAVYYAVMKALAVLSVIWYIVKIPFRIFFAVVKFIWRLIFGFPKEKKAFELDISINNLEKECARKSSEEQPKKKSSVRRRNKRAGSSSTLGHRNRGKSSLVDTAFEDHNGNDLILEEKESHGSLPMADPSSSFALTASLSLLLSTLAIIL